MSAEATDPFLFRQPPRFLSVCRILLGINPKPLACATTPKPASLGLRMSYISLEPVQSIFLEFAVFVCFLIKTSRQWRESGDRRFIGVVKHPRHKMGEF